VGLVSWDLGLEGSGGLAPLLLSLLTTLSSPILQW
jgi:hypothetical protein